MKVFGITGGVGAGKSEVLTYLGQNYDATVIQADEAGYLVMLPGGECYGEIVKLFGRQITTETGELDRKRIAEIVFQDEEVRKERLIEGRGYSEKKVREIMANQLSEDEFSSHCDFEIDNSGDFEETKKQLDHRMKKYETL